jgi:pimeloyl-ACP methyl ester carboxylesterase
MFALLLAVHLNCIGRGTPVVIIETGFDEPAAEWTEVSSLVAKVTRICTYDRAGHSGARPGPFPRTFDQINLELKLALAVERGPFVLAGHSYGGPVVRNFAERDPQLVAGMVLIDATHEGQQVFYGGAYHRLTEGATGRAIPPTATTGAPASTTQDATQDSEREWSGEYFARWLAHPQTGLLGSRPLAILARNAKNPDDAARERMLLQLSLASLSESATVTFIGFDHDMQKTIPGEVAHAIVNVVDQVRAQSRARIH